MTEDQSLRNKITSEFVAGLPRNDSVSIPSADVNENAEMDLFPELAADFEHGLESETADLCGCGCGQSCSGNSGVSLTTDCQGCHHHG
jgi:hypothetical protein